jgi:hypothetical protein
MFRSSILALFQKTLRSRYERITAVQQLSPQEREQIAAALVQAGLRSDLTDLIQELYAQPPDNNVTGDEIMAEIRAVRQQSPFYSS